MQKIRYKILVLILALPLFFYVFLQIGFFNYYFTNRRAPRQFLIPDGYQGFVVVAFDRSSCPEAENHDGISVFRISSQGDLCTSTDLAGGFGEDSYFYESSPKTNLMSDSLSGANYIWHERVGEKVYTFYVGYKLPETQLQDALAKRDERIQTLHKNE